MLEHPIDARATRSDRVTAMSAGHNQARADETWMELARKSFAFWDNEEDAAYDLL